MKINITILILFFAITGISCSRNQETNSVIMEDNKGIIHVGIVASDLEASYEFYTNVIGMKEIREFSIDSSFGQSSGLSRGEPFDVKVLQLRSGDYCTNWKLMTFNNLPEKQLTGNIQDGTGPRYVTIQVENLAPYIERLKQYNVEMLGSTPVELNSGNHFILVRDPDGLFIELIGPLEAQ